MIEEKRKKFFILDFSKRYVPVCLRLSREQPSKIYKMTQHKGPPRKVAKGTTIWKDNIEKHKSMVIQVYHIIITL
jgi:hypothetical protein